MVDYVKTITDQFTKGFDLIDTMVDDSVKAKVMEKVFEFIENQLIDKYDVQLVKEESNGFNIEDLRKRNGPIGFNVNTILRDKGSSKRLRMDEADQIRLQEIQEVSHVYTSTSTARDVARLVVERAVIQNDYIREELIDALTVGLSLISKDPSKWSKGQLK